MYHAFFKFSLHHFCSSSRGGREHKSGGGDGSKRFSCVYQSSMIFLNCSLIQIPTAAALVGDIANSIAAQHEQHILTLEPEEEDHLQVPEVIVTRFSSL
jgi:hypothetical protein